MALKTPESVAVPSAAEALPKTTPDEITLRIKVTFAFSCDPRKKHMWHFREVQIKSDGSDTVAAVKQKFADIEGIGAEHVQFLWFDKTIGREYENDPYPNEEEMNQTMLDTGVMPWVKKFPHWSSFMATVLAPTPLSALDAIHRAVATSRGDEDPDKTLRKLKKNEKEYNTLIK